MYRFLVPRWTEYADGEIALPEDELHHARVVRLRDGEDIEIFDGGGVSCRARFALPEGAEPVARLVERLPDRHRESAVAVTLAVAPLKKDRFEWLVEKATELGVARVAVFDAERGVANPSTKRRDRWQQIASGAAKQCGRTVLPEIDEVGGFQQMLAIESDHRIICDPSSPHLPLHRVLSANPEAKSVLLIVGPEGGFANKELQLARAAHASFASLGERVLRAETAAIAALSGAESWGSRAGNG